PIVLSSNDASIQQRIKALQYPCWIRAREGAGGLFSCRASNENIVEHWIRFHWDQGVRSDFIAEDYLPGRDYCFMSIWDRRTLASIKLAHPEWNFAWLASRLALGEEIPDCSKTNALPADLWFTKNTDMGFTMVRGNHWKVAELP